eukprot:scaffold14247_cov140-Isochrysis_galbana.AAC.1
MRGRCTRTRRLQGAQWGAIREPPRSVEKKANAKGMASTHSRGVASSTALVMGHRSAICGLRTPRSMNDAQCQDSRP